MTSVRRPVEQRPRTPAYGAGDVLRFAATYIAIVLMLAILLRLDHLVQHDAATTMFVAHVARIVALLVGFMGDGAGATGGTVFYESVTVEIVPDCTGIDMMGLYLAAVVAFPATGGQKLTGLAVGIPLLLALNLARLMSLIYVATWSDNALYYGHIWVWPWLLLIGSVSLWLSWARRVTGGNDPLV